MQKQEAKVRVIGKIGNWIFTEIRGEKSDGTSLRRWSAVFMRSEKLLGKPSKKRKKRIKLLMRRTEVVVDAEQEAFIAYSHFASAKGKAGVETMEPDPIPFAIIQKLMELREEGKSPIILPKSAKKIITSDFDQVKKGRAKQ